MNVRAGFLALGWVLTAGSAGSNHFREAIKGVVMRWLLCLLWLFCSGGAMAAALPLTLPSNVTTSGAGYVNKIAGVGVNFQGAAFNSGLTTQVAGKAVTVPAAWRLASNGPAIGVAALRATPGFATAAVLSYLVTYGLEKCLDGTWCHSSNGKPQEGAAGTVCYWSGGGCSSGWPTLQNVSYAQYVQAAQPGAYAIETPICQDGAPCTLVTIYYRRPNGERYDMPLKMTNVNKEVRPATDADWAPVSGLANLPDSVLNALIGNVSLPVNPEVDPTRQVVPLSDPYIDPVTGKRYRDVAYITPKATDPKSADLQVGKQEVDENGNPVIDPNTGQAKAPEKTDDPCLAHPERLGCMEKGEVPAAPDLEQNNKTITITPDSGWGADTAACPADLTSTLRQGGVAVAFSFKPVCDGADMFRPVVIGMAWVAAVLIALGVGRKGD